MSESEQRINDLEIKFTLQEDIIAELNDIVTKQQFTIDNLEKTLKQLTALLEEQLSENLQNPLNEKPPHY